MANPTLTRYHAPGGQEHDQQDHGNWADGGVSAWHGTPASRLDSIVKEGIITGKFNNWRGAKLEGASDDPFEKEVFVAKHPSVAFLFGEEAARQAGEDEFAIVRVRIPKSERLTKDLRTTKDSWTVEKVKHEWLVSADIYRRSDIKRPNEVPMPARRIKIHADGQSLVVYLPLPADFVRQLIDVGGRSANG